MSVQSSGHSLVQTTVQDSELVALRRGHIVDAAVELFRKKGYGGTSVRDIARAAGLPVGTLYQYIATKSDILYLVALDTALEVNKAIDDALRSPGSDGEKVVNALKAFLYAIAERRARVKIVYWDTHRLPAPLRQTVVAEETRVRELLRVVLDRGVEAGVFRPVNTFLLAQNIILFGHAWAIKGWALKDAISLDQYIEDQLDLLMHGAWMERAEPTSIQEGEGAGAGGNDT